MTPSIADFGRPLSSMAFAAASTWNAMPLRPGTLPTGVSPTPTRAARPRRLRITRASLASASPDSPASSISSQIGELGQHPGGQQLHAAVVAGLLIAPVIDELEHAPEATNVLVQRAQLVGDFVRA